MEERIEEIVEQVKRLPLELERYREMLLANLVMLGEIPAPTFHEAERIRFLEQRFTECGLPEFSVDEMGSGVGVLPGTDGTLPALLLTAHADTPFGTNQDHTITISAGHIAGIGVADNSLGLAVLATLPTILDGLGIRLRRDLLLLGAAGSLDLGDQRGLRFFLANCKRPLAAGVVVEGTWPGRLQYRSMASLGGVLSCLVDRRRANRGAIEVLCEVVARLRRVSLPDDGHSRLVLGTVSGGSSFKNPARSTQLRFQVRSRSDQVVGRTMETIHGILAEVSGEPGVQARFDEIARTRYGGLEPSHPLVIQARRILTALGIHPDDDPYSALISGFVEQGVPALCLGITQGENINELDEYVEIQPIMKGVASLIGVLLCLDGGVRDEH